MLAPPTTPENPRALYNTSDLGGLFNDFATRALACITNQPEQRDPQPEPEVEQQSKKRHRSPCVLIPHDCICSACLVKRSEGRFLSSKCRGRPECKIWVMPVAEHRIQVDGRFFNLCRDCQHLSKPNEPFEPAPLKERKRAMRKVIHTVYNNGEVVTVNPLYDQNAMNTWMGVQSLLEQVDAMNAQLDLAGRE
jgi:hypothetical protein